MSIALTHDGQDYELQLDGQVKSGGRKFGTWTTAENNDLEVTATDGGSVFTHPARWTTKDNRLSVQPDGAEAVDLLDASEGNIQFRLQNNRLVVDPLPEDDEFSFVLSGDWALSDDFSAIQLDTDTGALTFTGGLNDSQSRFVWAFDAENDSLKKTFHLRFEGAWRMKKRPQDKAGVLAVFAFEYELGGHTRQDTFEMPVEVSADAENGNRLLFTYKRTGSNTQWGVAFAGRFTTKGGTLIGYSAEVYDDNGKISSRFTFDLKGKIKDGSVATRNSLQFAVTIAGRQIDLTLSGRYNFTKSSISFSLQLNTSSRTGEISSISFGVRFATHKGTTVAIDIKTEAGGSITVSAEVGTAITLGGSRKGSLYAKFDMVRNGETFGIDALFGITLN